MYTVTRNNEICTVNGEIQLAAFINSGWTIYEEPRKEEINNIAVLREKADKLGIKYHHNLGEKKLKKLIDNYK